MLRILLLKIYLYLIGNEAVNFKCGLMMCIDVIIISDEGDTTHLLAIGMFIHV